MSSDVLAINEQSNIKGGFQGASLAPFNPEAVISELDIKLQTPTPIRSPNVVNDAWVSQTLHNLIEAVSQTEFVSLLKTELLAIKGTWQLLYLMLLHS